MSMSQLLSFYKLHYLETTLLSHPAPRKLIRVRAKFNFTGQVSVGVRVFLIDVIFLVIVYKFMMLRSSDTTKHGLHAPKFKLEFVSKVDDDLPFKRYEILYIIKKDAKNEWWTARNSLGQCGLIPANYVDEVCI